jgi:hypothetical protein
MNMVLKKALDYDYCFNKSKDPIKYIKNRLNTHNIDWMCILIYQKLSEEFIREFQSKLTNKCWQYVARYHRLDETFIEEFKDKLNWYLIDKHQVLSKEFLTKHKEDIYFDSNYTGVTFYNK